MSIASAIDNVIESYHNFALNLENLPYDQHIVDFINNQMVIPDNIPNFIVDPVGNIYQLSTSNPINSILNYHKLVYVHASTDTIKNSPIIEVW